MVVRSDHFFNLCSRCYPDPSSIRKFLSFLSAFLGFFFISTFSLAQTITYNYDSGPNGIGRLSSVSDSTGSTTFSYDVRGNVTQTVKVIDGNSFTIVSAYDSLNRVTSITYPDNEVVGYTYGPAGNLKTVGSYVTNITYDSFGHRSGMNLGNGTSTTYGYDPNSFRLNRIYTVGPAPTNTVLQDLNYCYDYVGNVTRIRGNAVCTDTTTGEVFGYDHLNRLTATKGPYGDFTSTPYTYDPIGNMTYNPQVGSYSYPASGLLSVRPHAVTTAGSNTYVYDANGNMISGAGRTISYDSENRPTSVTQGGSTIAMAYDYKGDRVKKVTSLATTYYVGDLYEKRGTATTKYIFAGSTRIALKSSDGTLLYYHGNHLGSTHVVTNASGLKVEEIKYSPFGGPFAGSDSGSVNVNHKYTSQELDGETGLYYYNARYYDPTLSRFISADTGGVRLSDPQTLNRYSYVLNNPLKYIDPTGRDPVQVDNAGNIVSVAPCRCGVIVTNPAEGTQISTAWNQQDGASILYSLWVMPDASEDRIEEATANLWDLINAVQIALWNASIDPIVYTLNGIPKGLPTADLYRLYGLDPPKDVRKSLTPDQVKQIIAEFGCAILPVGCTTDLYKTYPFLLGMEHKFSGMIINDILKQKVGSIKNAPLPSGSPSWEDVGKMTWEQFDKNAKNGLPGYQEMRKLLTDNRFNKK